MRRHSYVFSSIIVAALLAFAACSPDGTDVAAPIDVADGHDAANDPASPAFVPGEILIQYKSGATKQQIAAARAVVGAVIKEQIDTAAMQASGEGALELVSLPSGLAVEAAVRRLKDAPDVEFAEPNYIHQHADASNDPFCTGGSLWGMYGDESSPFNAFGSQPAEAWAMGFTGSSDVVVGIIDTGIDISHVELAGNIWTNPSDPVNGVDDDGNGYVDDVHGWDFLHGDNTVFDASDGDSHGTHVAGTIGAMGGNGKGVAGVNWHVTMIPAKFIGPDGGATSNAVKALDYLTDLKKRGLNIVAANNSWGGGWYSLSLQNAIKRANSAGILFVAAAGNDARNIDGLIPYYPASYDVENVISVAAIDSAGQLASFSNYGVNRVDLGAPGVMVVSTIPKNSYWYYNGTSMATPHVTGAIALRAAATNPSSHLALKQAILDTVIPTPSLKGKCATGGRLDASSFLPAAP